MEGSNIEANEESAISPQAAALWLPNGLLCENSSGDLSNHSDTDAEHFSAFSLQQNNYPFSTIWDGKSVPGASFYEPNSRDVSLLETSTEVNVDENLEPINGDGLQVVTETGAKFVIRSASLAEKLLLRPVRRAFVGALACWIRFCNAASLTRLDNLRILSRKLWAEISTRKFKPKNRNLSEAGMKHDDMFKHPVVCIWPVLAGKFNVSIDPSLCQWNDAAELEWCEYMVDNVKDANQRKRAIDSINLLQTINNQVIEGQLLSEDSAEFIDRNAYDMLTNSVNDLECTDTSGNCHSSNNDNINMYLNDIERSYSPMNENSGFSDDDVDDGIRVGVNNDSLVGPYSCTLTPKTRQQVYGSRPNEFLHPSSTAYKSILDTFKSLQVVSSDKQLGQNTFTGDEMCPKQVRKAVSKKKPTRNKELPNENDIRYKTKLCLHFMNSLSGACPAGKTCCFAHGTEELRRPVEHPNFRKKKCHYYAETEGAFCPFGKNCRFIHDIDPKEQKLVKPKKATAAKQKQFTVNCREKLNAKGKTRQLCATNSHVSSTGYVP